MARWEPNAMGRLQAAAMALFVEHGYAATTVQQIAERAGLTERTFYRYFVDKREVLFAGSDTLVETIQKAILGASKKVEPLEAVELALASTSGLFDARRAAAKQRNEVVMADPELRERELMKLMKLGAKMAESLQQRDVEESTAQLAAEVGLALFRVSFTRWLDDEAGHSYAEHVHACADELRSMSHRTEKKKRAKAS